MNCLKISIKGCCGKYNDFLVSNCYGQIIAGNLKITINQKLCQLKSKGPKYGEVKQWKDHVISSVNEIHVK